jgi:hypothetical protein
MSQPSWQRRFVGFVQKKYGTQTYDHLEVKIPREISDQVQRECTATGTHPMVYIADAMAHGLRDSLTKTDRR